MPRRVRQLKEEVQAAEEKTQRAKAGPRHRRKKAGKGEQQTVTAEGIVLGAQEPTVSCAGAKAQEAVVPCGN